MWNSNEVVFGIVILNYLKYELTISCIEMLEKIDYENFFVVVVDNLSPNESAQEISKYFHEHKFKFRTDFIVSDRNGGYSYGNNIGAKKALDMGAEYLIIMNNDIEINDKELLKKMSSFICANRDVSVIGPQIVKPNGDLELVGYLKQPIPLRYIFRNFFFPFAILLNKIKNVEKKTTKQVFSVSGSFFAIDLKIFEEIGYFDDSIFLFGEEIILGEKILRINGKVVFLPTVEVIHNHSKTIGSIYNRQKIELMQLHNHLYYYKNYVINKNVILLAIIKFSGYFKIYFWSPIIQLLRD